MTGVTECDRAEERANMTEFQRFLMGLRADARLGRYVPTPTPNTTPETLVLQLCLALADAVEGVHPAIKTLEELDSPAPLDLRQLALRGRVGSVMGKAGAR